LEHQQAAADWQRQGVLRTDGGDLAESTIPASLVLPSGLEGGLAFIVYPNLRVILGWNQSILYALAVGHLADRIIGGDAFVTPRPLQPMPPLSSAEVIEMQSLLSTLGYDAGSVDGIAGTRTRQAVKNFQQFANLPADGYPSQTVLYRLRQVAGR
jgi:membrane-bound lytic murein transglycosylase B